MHGDSVWTAILILFFWVNGRLFYFIWVNVTFGRKNDFSSKIAPSDSGCAIVALVTSHLAVDWVAPLACRSGSKSATAANLLQQKICCCSGSSSIGVAANLPLLQQQAAAAAAAAMAAAAAAATAMVAL